MASKQPGGAPNIVMVAIAAIATAGAIWNAASALLAGTVWVPSLSEFTLYRVERTDDAIVFYGILAANVALAAYFCWDVWRSHRNSRRADKE